MPLTVREHELSQPAAETAEDHAYVDSRLPVAIEEGVMLVCASCRGVCPDVALGVIVASTRPRVATSGPCGDAALIKAADEWDSTEEE